MSLEYVELTLDLYDGQGNPVTQGTATLTPTQVLTDTTDHEITGLTPVTATFRPYASSQISFGGPGSPLYGCVSVTAQKVTGSGQTISVYGYCTSAYTLTLQPAAAAIELAAYRVA